MRGFIFFSLSLQAVKILVDEHIWDFDLQAALRDVSEQRREQALRFRHELGQRLSVLAYRLLKRCLSELYGMEGNPRLEYDEHGKPAIAGRPDICFSLSHCREAVACAVSTRPVGIDVEAIREYRPSLVRYTMNDEETAAVERADDPAAAFIRLWTMKEATVKLTGTGISTDMKGVIDHERVAYHTTQHDRYVLSVAQWATDERSAEEPAR